MTAVTVKGSDFDVTRRGNVTTVTDADGFIVGWVERYSDTVRNLKWGTDRTVTRHRARCADGYDLGDGFATRKDALEVLTARWANVRGRVIGESVESAHVSEGRRWLVVVGGWESVVSAPDARAALALVVPDAVDYYGERNENGTVCYWHFRTPRVETTPERAVIVSPWTAEDDAAHDALDAVEAPDTCGTCDGSGTECVCDDAEGVTEAETARYGSVMVARGARMSHTVTSVENVRGTWNVRATASDGTPEHFTVVPSWGDVRWYARGGECVLQLPVGVTFPDTRTGAVEAVRSVMSGTVEWHADVEPDDGCFHCGNNGCDCFDDAAPFRPTPVTEPTPADIAHAKYRTIGAVVSVGGYRSVITDADGFIVGWVERYSDTVRNLKWGTDRTVTRHRARCADGYDLGDGFATRKDALEVLTARWANAVSYTHLTLPTNREV